MSNMQQRWDSDHILLSLFMLFVVFVVLALVLWLLMSFGQHTS